MGPTVEQNFAEIQAVVKDTSWEVWCAKRVVVKTSRILEKIRPSVTKKNIYFKNMLSVLACYWVLMKLSM